VSDPWVLLRHYILGPSLLKPCRRPYDIYTYTNIFSLTLASDKNTIYETYCANYSLHRDNFLTIDKYNTMIIILMLMV